MTQTTTPIHWSLGDRLAKARKVAGLEQSEIASVLGVSRALVSQWENDKAEPRLSQVAAFAEMTKQPFVWFLGSADVQGYQPTSDALTFVDPHQESLFGAFAAHAA